MKGRKKSQTGESKSYYHGKIERNRREQEWLSQKD